MNSPTQQILPFTQTIVQTNVTNLRDSTLGAENPAKRRICFHPRQLAILSRFEGSPDPPRAGLGITKARLSKMVGAKNREPRAECRHLVGGAFVVAGGFGFVTFFFAGGFFAGSVSSTTIFFGGGGGAADSVLTCARKRVNSTSLAAASFCMRSPNSRRAVRVRSCHCPGSETHLSIRRLPPIPPPNQRRRTAHRGCGRV